VTAVVTSPLTRALQSAAIIAELLGVEALTIVNALTERSFGVAEGWTEDEIRAKYATDEHIPGRESNADIAARAWPVLQNLDEHTLVVTHHGVIRSLGVDGPIANASIHRIDGHQRA
jgi:uncharacterized phosphatase